MKNIKHKSRDNLYKWRKMYRWKIIDSVKGKTLGFSKKRDLRGIIELDVRKIPPGVSLIEHIRRAEQCGIIICYPLLPPIFYGKIQSK